VGVKKLTRWNAIPASNLPAIKTNKTRENEREKARRRDQKSEKNN